MHVRSHKPLQDVMTAVRLGKPVAECGFELQPNAEVHLRARLRLAGIYSPELLQATLTVASRCSFSLDELRYQYPVETVLPGLTRSETLRRFTYDGMSQRYPQGIPDTVQLQVEHELDLIAELKYEMYFLTVYDIVRFARERHILCQGRGSAANSAVCYCLGVTEVDPSRMNVLFERFISRKRRGLLAAQPKLLTPVLQVVHRVITRHLLGQAGLKADEADSGAVTLIQRFGSAANLNIHLHCPLLNGVYRRGTDGAPEFVEAPAPVDEALQAVLHKIITRLMRLLTQLDSAKFSPPFSWFFWSAAGLTIPLPSQSSAPSGASCARSS